MSDDFLKIKIPTGVRVHKKITRVCKVPKLFVYEEGRGLYIKKWKISEVYMCTKFIEGPISFVREEKGIWRNKNRYYVEMWPEMGFKATREILDFVKDKKRSGDYNPLIHLYPPSVEVLEQMENVAARLYRNRKKENLENIENWSVGCMTFEVSEFEAEPSGFFQFAHPKSDGGADLEEPLEIKPEEDDFTFEYCKVFEKQLTSFYISKYIPQPIMECQLKDPHWQVIRKLFCYKKAVMTSMIVEMDVDDFGDLGGACMKDIFSMAWVEED